MQCNPQRPARTGTRGRSALQPTAPGPARTAVVSLAVAGLLASACASTEATRPREETRSLAYEESSSASSVRTALDCAVREESPLIVQCAQCPAEPTARAVARNFSAAASIVSACVPELGRGASLRVRGEFASVGVALRFDLRGPSLAATQARCLERALCAVRVPTFRTPSAIVRYEFGESTSTQ